MLKGSPAAPIDDTLGGYDIIQEYGVASSAASVQILRSRRDSEIVYSVREPQLGEKELKELRSLKGEISDLLPDLLGNEQESKFDLGSVLTKFIEHRRPWLKGDALFRIQYYLFRDFRGYGIIDTIVNDSSVEDVSCDGPNIPIFVYHKNYGSIRSNISFSSADELNSYIVRLSQMSGKSVSVSTPILDSITKDGHRVQAVYGSEISSRGPVFTLRLFRERPFTPVDLIRSGTANSEMMAYLWFMVESLNSAMIVGAPGAGKTSTLNSILTFAPVNTKVFSIEETRELNIPHEKWVAAETRDNNGASVQKGVEKLSLFDLVSMAMRQRPTYIVVGEVRGRETYALFQAMATGHTVYSTIHADSMESLLNRLENEPMDIPRVLVSYLNIVIFINIVRFNGSLVRRITEVDEIVGIDGKSNEILYNRVFRYDPNDDSFFYGGSSRLFERVMEQRNIDRAEMEREIKKRRDILDRAAKEDVKEQTEISGLIRSKQLEWFMG